MIENYFDPWSAEQEALYERAQSGIDISYTDHNHDPREPTAIERETDRIFSLLSDSVMIEIGEDAAAFTQALWVPEEYASGVPIIRRAVDANGELARIRYSGLLFIPRETCEALESNSEGSISVSHKSEGLRPRNNLATRLNLYRKLRSIK